jgi:ferredoxin--NADP+ reductase
MPDLSQTHMQGTITWRKDYAPDLWSIKIRPQAPIPFKPGQYVSLGVQEGEGKPIERPYSVVSAPHEPELELFFELVPHGELTPRLHKLQVGAEVLLRKKAKGAFTLDAKSGHRKHFFAATVTGVAPCVSIVRHLDREAREGRPFDDRLLILEGASRSWELAYDAELKAIADRSNWLRFVPSVSRPWEDKEWKGEVGRVEDLLRKYLDDGFDPKTTTGYLCGHPGMIENGKGILLRRGFERDDIHVEVYWIPPKEPQPKIAAAAT